MRRDKVHLLAACFVLTAVSTLVGQKTTEGYPEPPSIAALEELRDLRVRCQRQAYMPLRIEEMTQDYFQFYLQKPRFEGIVERDTAPSLVTLRKGQTLPGSDLVVTDLTETIEKVGGIRRAHREIHVRSSRSGWSYTYTPDILTDLSTEPNAAAFYYRFTLFRPDDSAIPIEPGEEFVHPENSTTKYKVKAIYLRNVVIERLSDGQLFKVVGKSAGKR